MKWNKKYKILVIFCQDIICKFTNIYFNPKTQHKCNAQFKIWLKLVWQFISCENI